MQRPPPCIGWSQSVLLLSEGPVWGMPGRLMSGDVGRLLPILLMRNLVRVLQKFAPLCSFCLLKVTAPSRIQWILWLFSPAKCTFTRQLEYNLRGSAGAGPGPSPPSTFQPSAACSGTDRKQLHICHPHPSPLPRATWASMSYNRAPKLLTSRKRK